MHFTYRLSNAHNHITRTHAQKLRHHHCHNRTRLSIPSSSVFPFPPQSSEPPSSQASANTSTVTRTAYFILNSSPLCHSHHHEQAAHHIAALCAFNTSVVRHQLARQVFHTAFLRLPTVSSPRPRSSSSVSRITSSGQNCSPFPKVTVSPTPSLNYRRSSSPFSVISAHYRICRPVQSLAAVSLQVQAVSRSLAAGWYCNACQPPVLSHCTMAQRIRQPNDCLCHQQNTVAGILLRCRFHGINRSACINISICIVIVSFITAVHHTYRVVPSVVSFRLF